MIGIFRGGGVRLKISVEIVLSYSSIDWNLRFLLPPFLDCTYYEKSSMESLG